MTSDCQRLCPRLRRDLVRLAALRMALALVPFGGVARASPAQPADWPARPVHLIVPAPAGGAYDRTARLLAPPLAAQLGQPVVVENRPGAGNIVGTQAGTAAAPDGYTLTMTGMANTLAQAMYAHVSFDIVADFAHVAGIGGGPQWLVVHAGAGIGSFAELVERARRAPGTLDYATSGQGSTGHLLMELLQQATGTRLVHVPYKGGGPALQDVLAGRVPVTVVPAAGALPHVQGGRLRVLAVSSAARSPDLPLVPTFAELGHPSLTVSAWVGISAPRGTPPAVVERIVNALRGALAQRDLVARLEAEGMTVALLPPVAYAQLVRKDTERWGALVRSLNLKAE